MKTANDYKLPIDMRKVIFAINMSLDGCCDHTQFTPDEAILRFFTQLLQDADTLVYGRKTYELMVPYWPDIAKNRSGDTKGALEFAQAFAAVPQMIVCSRSLMQAEGQNTIIVRSNLPEVIQQLKQEPGKNISIGGVSVPAQLMALGLVDEYYFVVHPIIVGSGPRLLAGANIAQKLHLKLVDSKVFSSGCMVLHYVKAE